MNVSVTREGNDAALKIAVTAAEVDKSFKQAVARIANQVRIPGFRPGKAPRNIIEMHYGKAAVKEEAFNICVNRAYQTLGTFLRTLYEICQLVKLLTEIVFVSM